MPALTHPQPGTVERFNRNDLGQFAQVPRFDYLNRYFADAGFRAEQDAERDRYRQAQAIEMDRQLIAQFRGEDEPGWLSAVRARVAAFDDRRYAVLIMAGISHEEAIDIVSGEVP
jgi:hypothetical protein